MKIFINNKICRVTHIDLEQQKYPWPGDGKYTLVLSNRDPYFEKILDLCREPKLCISSIFFFLNTTISILQEKEKPEDLKWILNTVDNIKIDSNEIVIEGICSSFLHPYEKPKNWPRG